MPAKKPPFTFEQHLSWGMKLSLINDELSHLWAEMGTAYPGTHARPVRSIIRKLAQVRSDLDSKVFAEHPDENTEVLSRIYYPLQAERDKVRSGTDEPDAGAVRGAPGPVPQEPPAQPA